MNNLGERIKRALEKDGFCTICELPISIVNYQYDSKIKAMSINIFHYINDNNTNINIYCQFVINNSLKQWKKSNGSL